MNNNVWSSSHKMERKIGVLTLAANSIYLTTDLSVKRWTESQLNMLYNQNQPNVLHSSLHLEHFSKRIILHKLKSNWFWATCLSSQAGLYPTLRSYKINSKTIKIMSYKKLTESGNPLNTYCTAERFYSTKGSDR